MIETLYPHSIAARSDRIGSPPPLQEPRGSTVVLRGDRTGCWFAKRHRREVDLVTSIHEVAHDAIVLAYDYPRALVDAGYEFGRNLCSLQMLVEDRSNAEGGRNPEKQC